MPSLNRLLGEAAEAVIDPATGKSIARATREGGERQASALPTAGGSELVDNRLGSGSDYTVFLNFLGVPVADLSFTGPYGVYHSMYDDHLWMEKFGDPGFRYHVAMAQLWGVVALRLANADVLPLDYRAYAARIGEFVAELTRAAGADEQAHLEPLRPATARLAAAADAIAGRASRALSRPASGAAARAAINRDLMQAERAFLDPGGIPGRPWYRHLIYAPRPTYAPELLPGVAEALGTSQLDVQVQKLVAAIDRAAAALQK